MVRKGTLQGGILSPLLWNLAVNSLLKRLEHSGNDAIAYADDIDIAPSGICLQTLLNKLNLAIMIVLDCQLTPPTSSLPSISDLNGLILSPEVKYLGLILDHKLTWGANLAARARKAEYASYSCSRAVGNRWGLSPRIKRWIYSAVVESNLLYCVVFWWIALDKQCNVRLLDKVRKSVTIHITSALRTKPTKALFARLNWLSTALLAKWAAKVAVIRLNALTRWDTAPSGHSIILGVDPLAPEILTNSLLNIVSTGVSTY